MNKAEIPAGATTEEQRRKIGQLLRGYVESGLTQKGDIETWWAQVERYYRNEPAESSDAPTKDYVQLHVPLSQPRQDALTSEACGTVFGQTPVMAAMDYGSAGRAKTKENVVEFFWRGAGISKLARVASTICTNTNKAIWKQTFVRQPKGTLAMQQDSATTEPGTGAPDRLMGLRLEVIHPKDFICTPAGLGGILAAVATGNRFYRRVREVKQYQALGMYFDDVEAVSGGDNPVETDTTGGLQRASTAVSVENDLPEDSLVEMWDLIVKLPVDESGAIDLEGGLEERYFRATVEYKSGILLDIDGYPLSRPWYFSSEYIPDEFGFWSGKSVGRNLSVLQDAFNKLHSALYNGAMMEFATPIFGTDLPEKYSKYGHFDVVDMEGGAQPWAPTLRFASAQTIFQQANQIERVADAVARVSSNSLGAQSQRVQTASEASIIQQGVQAGLQEYIANFASEFPAMAQFALELLVDQFVNWSPFYGEMLGIKDVSELKAPCTWQVTGQQPGNTPTMQAQWAERLSAFSLQFPEAGIDNYQLAGILLHASALPGADQVQKPQEQVQQEMAAQQEAQQQAEQATHQAMLEGKKIDQETALMVEKMKLEAQSDLENQRAGLDAIGREHEATLAPEPKEPKEPDGQ